MSHVYSIWMVHVSKHMGALEERGMVYQCTRVYALRQEMEACRASYFFHRARTVLIFCAAVECIRVLVPSALDFFSRSGRHVMISISILVLDMVLDVPVNGIGRQWGASASYSPVGQSFFFGEWDKQP